MSKFIQLIDLDEIKTLRVTCEECHAYWSVPVPLGKNELPNKCNYCKEKEAVIPNNHLEYIEGLLKNIDNIHKFLKGFKISIELETEKEKQVVST